MEENAFNASLVRELNYLRHGGYSDLFYLYDTELTRERIAQPFLVHASFRAAVLSAPLAFVGALRTWSNVGF